MLTRDTNLIEFQLDFTDDYHQVMVLHRNQDDYHDVAEKLEAFACLLRDSVMEI